MFRHPDPEVLVVGAGPVGLVAALFLQRDGVRVEIVDMHERTSQFSYALAIHPRTLRILDEAGLSEGLINSARKVTKVAYYEGPERRAEIDYSTLASKHPYLLVIRQSVLETAVEKALRQTKLKVRWGHRLQSLDADGTIPRAEVAKLEQVQSGYAVAHSGWAVVRTQTIRPAYVIGADGYDSAVRRMAGIELEDHGAAQIFSVYEIEAAGELPAEVRVILDPDLTSVYWPLEKGRCRWGFQIRDASEHAPSMERLAQLIAARAPWSTVQTNPDILVDTRRVRASPDAELRQRRRLARRGRRAPGGSSRCAQHEFGAGRSARAGSAHIANPARGGSAAASPRVRDRDARGVAMAPRHRPDGAGASRSRPVGPTVRGEDPCLHSCLGRRPRTAAQADRSDGRALK